MSKGRKDAEYGAIRFENKNRTKAFLRKVRELDIAVDVAMRQVEYCEASATRITPYYSNMASNHNMNGSEDKVINLLDAREKCNRAIDRFADYRDKCLMLIELIPSAAHRQVLTLRYINYLKWERIAKEMRYSEAQIFRMHNQSLAEFKKILENKSNYDSK